MTDTAVKTTDLRKQYRLGDVTVDALEGVSIAVDRGEFVSIMGPSGSGKSTLMHLLGLLDTPTSGTIRIGDRDTSTLSEAQRATFRRTRLGFVFQFYSLLSGFSALENAVLPQLLNGVGQQEAVARARQALDSVGLSDRLQHTPSELSGGQRQRAAIARALVNDPELILADEPASQLDTETSAQVMDVFDELAGGDTTVIVVNHEQRLGERADRILWLEDGRIDPDRST